MEGSKQSEATVTSVLKWLTCIYSLPSFMTYQVCNCRGRLISHLFILPYFLTISLTFLPGLAGPAAKNSL